MENTNNANQTIIKQLSTKTRRRMEYKTNSQLQSFQQNMKKYLTTTRFNNNTWDENCNYRNKKTNIGCIYGTPDTASEQIIPDGIIFVLEMNNDMNKIMGIGMIRNKHFIKKHHIYSNEQYNRYSYVGKYRIDRNDMSDYEEIIMKAFDHLCFKGPRHMKRLSGIRLFPIDMLYNISSIIDLVDFITNMFKIRLSSHTEIKI